MKNNPFSLDFGGKPKLFISRMREMDRIISTFLSPVPSAHMFMILGARGNGKTVLMSAATEKLLEDNRWIHVDLSPESDMMHSLAASLYQKSRKQFSKLKLDVKIDLKIASIGISSDNDERYSSAYTDIDAMLEQLNEKSINLLITIDEAVNSKSVREFTIYFQHCIREGYRVFLLMTGLYKNIRALQNNKTQTFLKRSPRIVIAGLHKTRIADEYREVFGISEKEAQEMSDHTCGYSYAFQILGYLVFEYGKRKVTPKILKEYRLILEECSYDKIWEELSDKERRVALAAAKAPDNVRVRDLREELKMESNEFSTYKDTLEKSGVFAASSAYGYVNFALPYIKEYICTKEL